MTKDCTPEVVKSIKDRRVEDQLRLQELELQTKFQIQTLSESLNLLKTDFHTWRDSLNEKIENVKSTTQSLNTRLTVLIALVIAQMAEAPSVLLKILGM